MAALAANSIPSPAFEAEAGVAASAPVAPPNLACMCEQLETLNFHRIVLEPDWHGQGQTDFQARLVATQYQSAFGEGAVPLASGVANSETSSMSMAVSVHSLPYTGSMRSQYEPSIHAPSLVTGSSVLGSSSAQTSDASLLVQNPLLEEEEEGLLVVPHQQLSCTFWFLGCKEEFEDLMTWDIHCQSHLREKLPLTAWCPFHRCSWTHTASSGETAWRMRFDHITDKHSDGHLVDIESRPESGLIRHLWNSKLIDNIQLKELRLHGRVTNDRVFTNTEQGRGSHRRRDRR